MYECLSSDYLSLSLFLPRLFLSGFRSVLLLVVLSLWLLLYHARVVADEQHTEQCACNFAEPAETSEDEKSGGNESQH